MSSCSFCYKETQDLKKCSKCHKRKFCSLECQKSDWKLHKLFCGKACEEAADFETKMTQDRGYGVFALQEIKKYEIVMVERVIIKRDVVMKLMSGDLKESDFPFSESERKAFFRLSCDEYEGPEEMSTLIRSLNIFSRNAYGDGRQTLDSNGIGTDVSLICINIAKCNHSCNPNVFVHVETTGDLQYLVVQAARDIKKSEEVLVSYCDFPSLKEDRQEKLLEQFKFQCACPLCMDPNSDEILIKIKEISSHVQEMLENGYDESQGKKGMELIENMVDLLNKSNLTPDASFLSRALFNGFVLGSRFQDLHPKAYEFLKQAYDFNVKVYGEKDVDSIIYKDHLDNVK